MKECIYDFYDCDGKIKKCTDFDDGLIKEGKCLYEVIRLIKGSPLFFEKHIERLNNSARITGLKLWMSGDEIRECIEKTKEANKVYDGNIKIIFNFNDTKQSKKFACYFISHHYPSEEEYNDGVKTILYHGERQNPNAKIINTAFRNTVDEEIRKNGAYEAILADNNGYITEGSKSNIFLIKGNDVFTAPVSTVLPGVTRNVILEVLKCDNIPVYEEKIHYTELKSYEALFISGTSPKVLPVSMVDDIKYNSSSNALVCRIMNDYNCKIKTYIDSQMVNDIK